MHKDPYLWIIPINNTMKRKKTDKNYEYEMNLKKHIKKSWKKLNRLYLSTSLVELTSKLFVEFKKVRAIKSIARKDQTQNFPFVPALKFHEWAKSMFFFLAWFTFLFHCDNFSSFFAWIFLFLW